MIYLDQLSFLKKIIGFIYSFNKALIDISLFTINMHSTKSIC